MLGNRLPARERTLQESLQESRGSYAKISRSVSLSWRANAWFTESVDGTRLITFVSLLFFISFVCWFFTPPLSFLHMVCILCIIAFGASSFYSFLYQKCTTLYHILNNYDEVCFLFSFVVLFSRRESVVSCGRIEKPHCFSCICFYRMLKPHVASSFT